VDVDEVPDVVDVDVVPDVVVDVDVVPDVVVDVDVVAGVAAGLVGDAVRAEAPEPKTTNPKIPTAPNRAAGRRSRERKVRSIGRTTYLR
jgi:hypothetical protein